MSRIMFTRVKCGLSPVHYIRQAGSMSRLGNRSPAWRLYVAPRDCDEKKPRSCRGLLFLLLGRGAPPAAEQADEGQAAAEKRQGGRKWRLRQADAVELDADERPRPGRSKK